MLYLGREVEKINAAAAAANAYRHAPGLKGGINHCSIITTLCADLSRCPLPWIFFPQQTSASPANVILSDFLESGLDETSLYTSSPAHWPQRRSTGVGIGGRISAHAAVIAEWFPNLRCSIFREEFRKDLHQLHFPDETILLGRPRLRVRGHRPLCLFRSRSTRRCWRINLKMHERKPGAIRQHLPPTPG